MLKISTMQTSGKNISQGRLTIGLDLGDRSSAYCVLNNAGEIVLEHKLATTAEAMKQVFGSLPRCRIAMETGTHSPWVSRVLTDLGHEVIVAHAQKVRLIVKSRRKDDRLDARTLARLARIDPELLSPVKHRSAQAQLHLTEIRARAVLVSARTALVNAARGLVKSYGERLPKCGTQQFSRETTSGLSTGLREALEPLLREVESLNERIREYDRRIETSSRKSIARRQFASRERESLVRWKTLSGKPSRSLASLKYTIFKYTQGGYTASLLGCEISYADATGCDFSGANMVGCLLYRSETYGAKLRDVLLSEESDIPKIKVFQTGRVSM